MIKNECKIVRDLFPNYIEKQISNETKEFVDNHLKDCIECSELLSDIKSENADIKPTKKEIDFLKIYNIQMLIAKAIIAILLCIIISTGSVLGYRRIKGAKVYNIITEISAKKDEFFKNNNFVIKEISNNESIRTLSVYGNYSKEENEYINEDFAKHNFIQYGRLHNNKDTITIYVNGKNGNIVTLGAICSEKYVEHTYNSILYQLDTILTRNKMNCYTINVTEEKVKDTNCYVLEETNKYCISKWYIDINTMLMKKFEKTELDGSVQESIEYSYSAGTVEKDEIVLTEKDGKLVVKGAEYDYGKDIVSKNILADYLN